MPVELEELILRFPSAPIHGLQRRHAHHVQLAPSENFHTFRVLRSSSRAVARKPVKRIFLMHTGLNERGTMGLYYHLASQLIERDEQTVCIVRPFPGHMTRYPFGAFAETPLDLYLWDGSHLFRQFMRFMVETQWFLSAVVRRSSYRCASGANLLGEEDDIEKSRLDPDVLAGKMREEWRRLQQASVNTAEAEAKADESTDVPQGPGTQVRTPVNLERAYQRQLATAIRGLRSVLRLERDFPPQSGELGEADNAGEETEPSYHAIGYSLGGSTAQSVFMSWPFIVSSCSTMLAGGALRELAPTGFADAEEWQTVLHSLRYELDDRMMSTRIDVEDDHVAGIDRELFTYLKRTFYEVFQQEYKGSIQTRYEAFGDRMFFVVGGDDPVMRPETVLESGPKGGLNLLELGGVDHFLRDRSGGESSPADKTLWLPEIATLIDRFSAKAADEHARNRRAMWMNARMTEPVLSREEWEAMLGLSGAGGGDDGSAASVRPLSAAELIEIEHEGALPGELFERCLDDLLHRITRGDGTLFILRNEMPTVLLPKQAVRETAAAHYHDDLSIVRYCHGIAARREVLEKHLDKICLVLPWNASSLMMRMDAHRGFPSQGESADFAADKGNSKQKMLAQIRKDRIRIVNVSRARFNPRFRGRLVVDGTAARKRLMHAALCVGLSERIAGKERAEVFG